MLINLFLYLIQYNPVIYLRYLVSYYITLLNVKLILVTVIVVADTWFHPEVWGVGETSNLKFIIDCKAWWV